MALTNEEKRGIAILIIVIVVLLFLANISNCSGGGNNDEPVKNSAYDASVTQVNKYLKSNLKDPKSYESIEWSAVNKDDKGYWVRHKYRAKNSFGGYVISNQIFIMDKNGNVIDVLNLE